MPTAPPTFRFVDLFAGIGGFHAVMEAFGGECVYAVEIDRRAANVYEANWGHAPNGAGHKHLGGLAGDITLDADDDLDIMNVPEHDVLCAGFPCQPFSKSGAQRGMDEARGTLFFNIASIIKAHHPKVVLLENARPPTGEPAGPLAQCRRLQCGSSQLGGVIGRGLPPPMRSVRSL